MSKAKARSDRAGEGVGGGYPPRTVMTFSKIRISKLHFRASKNVVVVVVVVF